MAAVSVKRSIILFHPVILLFEIFFIVTTIGHLHLYEKKKSLSNCSVNQRLILTLPHEGVIIRFWETAHIPLPYDNINTFFSLRKKCWPKGGVEGQFPRKRIRIMLRQTLFSYCRPICMNSLVDGYSLFVCFFFLFCMIFSFVK